MYMYNIKVKISSLRNIILNIRRVKFDIPRSVPFSLYILFYAEF